MTLTQPFALLLTLLSLTSQAEVKWQPIDNHVTFIQQADKLKYFDSNQVILAGKDCVAIFDASGSFTQVELMADEVKTQFTQPVCYLIASHPHDDHLLGMALLQQAFPQAKLITHSAVGQGFTKYQQALSLKLDNFKKSISLNEKRIKQLEPEQQAIWHEKITLAKERLSRWQSLTLHAPAIRVEQNITLNLGDYPLEILPAVAHSAGDLMVFLPQSQLLLSGDVGDALPYAGEASFNTWLSTLNALQTLSATHLIPGHGDITTIKSLTTTLSFLSALHTHANAETSRNGSAEDIIKKFDFKEKTTIVKSPLDEQAYRMFVGSGLKQATKQPPAPRAGD